MKNQPITQTTPSANRIEQLEHLLNRLKGLENLKQKIAYMSSDEWNTYRMAFSITRSRTEQLEHIDYLINTFN